MEDCKCGHLWSEHHTDGEYGLNCHLCKCEGFESQDPPSFRGHTGAYARIESAFDTIKEQVDAILAAEEDPVKRSSLAAEIGRVFVKRYHEFLHIQGTVDAAATASLDSR